MLKQDIGLSEMHPGSMRELRAGVIQGLPMIFQEFLCRLGFRGLKSGNGIVPTYFEEAYRNNKMKHELEV